MAQKTMQASSAYGVSFLIKASWAFHRQCLESALLGIVFLGENLKKQKFTDILTKEAPQHSDLAARASHVASRQLHDFPSNSQEFSLLQVLIRSESHLAPGEEWVRTSLHNGFDRLLWTAPGYLLIATCSISPKIKSWS